MPFFFILSLRQVGHLISRVIRISLFYQNSTCFVSAYFLKHHPVLRVILRVQCCLLLPYCGYATNKFTAAISVQFCFGMDYMDYAIPPAVAFMEGNGMDCASKI